MSTHQVTHYIDGEVQTTTNVVTTVVKMPVRVGWSGTLLATVTGRLAAGTCARYEARVAVKNVAGVITIDGAAVLAAPLGVAALTAIAITVSVAADPGYVSIQTPGIAATTIDWVGHIEFQAYHP